MTEAIIERSATALVAAISSGDLTVEEVARAHLNQIEAINPTVNAIVSPRPKDDILTEARALDDAGPKGVLAGLPMAVKDLADVAGLPTTFGSPLFRDNVPAKDGLLAARLRAAGALIIGKTNTPEFGLGSHSYNPVHGLTRNPYDATKSAGGSSGGAGAALATHMVPLADGSDMMGSLRNPAGWNNVYGFRPSYGLVPDDPVGDAFLHQLATDGPMARNIEDLALLLGVLGQPTATNPHFVPGFAGIRPPSPGTTIGWISDWNGYYPMEPGIIELCEAALDVFAGAGFTIRPFTPKTAPETLWQSWITLRSWAVSARLGPIYDNPKTRGHLKPEAIWEIEQGRSLNGADIHAASEIRSGWFREVATLDGIDILALPSAQMFPFDASLDWPKEIAGHAMDTYHRWMEVVVPASLIGIPALCVPAGFGASGLPMGLQLVGKRGQDAAVLGLGHTYHQRTKWPQNRPVLSM